MLLKLIYSSCVELELRVEEIEPIPKPQSQLSLNFSTLFNNPEFADVRIIVNNDKTILAHKPILGRFRIVPIYVFFFPIINHQRLVCLLF
jgi:hypothetical protein